MLTVKQIRYVLPLMTMIASSIAGCSPSFNSGLLKQSVEQAAPGEAVKTKPFSVPEEIDDLRRIPQDVRLFSAAIRTPISTDEQARALQNFRDRYFSPWTAPLYNIN